MENKQSIHEKAIRLLEGGIVEVEGHSVKLVQLPLMSDPCFCCEMDCLCHIGGEICSLCTECDAISNLDCLLMLVDAYSDRP